MTKRRYIAVVGATASGKSALAMRLAETYRGELVNCDSVQFYKGFDIGAAKPTQEEQRRIPHHLWNRVEWHEDYDARAYAADAEKVLLGLESKGVLPIVVGGTGLYLRALWREGWHDLPKDDDLRARLATLSLGELRIELDRLDPQRSLEIHDNDRFRLQRAVEVASLLGHSIKDLEPSTSLRGEALLIKMVCPRQDLEHRIERRTALMLSEGLLAEVEGLLKSGVDPNCKPMQSIGYKECVQVLQKQLPEAELEKAIIIATRQYAKRQETWFRKVKADFEWHGENSLDDLKRLLKAHFAACAHTLI